MIVLDTNVVSDLLRAAPSPVVLRWLAVHAADGLFVAEVSRAEILFGIACMPIGQRRFALAERALGLFQEDLGGRVLPFDESASVAYADIAASARRAGRPLAVADAMIAATALSRGATLATRDAALLATTGLTTVNPWADPDAG